MITLNIGLNHGLPAQVHNPVSVLSTLASHGFAVYAHRLAQSDTEPTLVAFVHPPCEAWGDALYLVAAELNQTAIAWSGDGGATGGLVGPGATSWGGGIFAPDYFIPLNP